MTRERVQRGPAAWSAWWFSTVALACLSIPVVARLFSFEWGPLAYVVSMIPWVTAALVVPLVIALVLRSWPLVGVAGALFALCAVWIAPLYVGAEPAGEPVLRVATINLGFGFSNPNAVVAMVRDNSIDVLAVQELTHASLQHLEEAGLDELLPHRAVDPEFDFTGAGLWSRDPLTDTESLDGYISNAIRGEVQTATGPLTVYSVHPVSPGARNNLAWKADLARLTEELDAATGPVLVAGDFNATRDHRAFREIEALGYIDAADQADAGFHPTFPEIRFLIPLVAIDHVMVRGVDMRASSLSAVAIYGADHRALVVVYTAE